MIHGYFDVIVMQFIETVIKCSVQWLNNNN